MKSFKLKLLILLVIGCFAYFMTGKKEERSLKWKSQGETWTVRHLSHLKQIESSKDLKKIRKSIQQDYQELADLLVKVYDDNKSDVVNSFEGLSSQGAELQKEMERVLEIEGCKKYFEQCQKAAMQKFARAMRQDKRALSGSSEKKDSKSALRSVKKD